MDQILFSGCFVCGPDNDCGLKSTFRTLDTGEVEGVFTPDVKHSDTREWFMAGSSWDFSMRFSAGWLLQETGFS